MLFKNTRLVAQLAGGGAGLVGTLWSLATLFWLPERLFWPVALGVLGASWAAGAPNDAGAHDDPRIVVGETVGFWVAAGLPRTAGALAAAFVLFAYSTRQAAAVPALGELCQASGW